MIKDKLKKYCQDALTQFTTGEYYNQLLLAKEKYFSITGEIQEEDEDYENRMYTFNDWYLFQYKLQGSQTSPMINYLMSHDVDDDIKKTLEECRYSLFEYKGKSFFWKRYN